MYKRYLEIDKFIETENIKDVTSATGEENGELFNIQWV